MLEGKEPSKATLEPIDPSKLRTMRGSSMRASGSDFRKTSGRAGNLVGGGVTPSLKSNNEKMTGVNAGTPQKGTGKRTDTLRQSGKSV
jgi:hypothetical protein